MSVNELDKHSKKGARMQWANKRFQHAAPAFLSCLALPCTASADEIRSSDSPFKIEDFAPKKGRATFSAGIGYAASDSRNVSVSTIAVPISYSYALLIPDVTLNNRRRDAIYTRLGVRYAFGNRFNISAGLKADAERNLVRQNHGHDTQYSAGWRNLTLGTDYRITSPFSHPFVLGFAELALAENTSDHVTYGSAATVGVGSHWAFDPVIASLTATYSYLGARQSQGKRYNPGDVVAIAGSFGVAMNPEITLRSGIVQSFRTADTGTPRHGEATTLTAFTLGYTQRLSSLLVMNIDAQAGVAGNEVAQVWVNFTWRL
nr:hypothetical protein [uncultured Cupriavidus sp.]